MFPTVLLLASLASVPAQSYDGCYGGPIEAGVMVDGWRTPTAVLPAQYDRRPYLSAYANIEIGRHEPRYVFPSRLSAFRQPITRYVPYGYGPDPLAPYGFPPAPEAPQGHAYGYVQREAWSYDSAAIRHYPRIDAPLFYQGIIVEEGCEPYIILRQPRRYRAPYCD